MIAKPHPADMSVEPHPADDDLLTFRTEFYVQGSWCNAAIRFEDQKSAAEHGKYKLATWFVPTGWRVVDTLAQKVVESYMMGV